MIVFYQENWENTYIDSVFLVNCPTYHLFLYRVLLWVATSKSKLTIDKEFIQESCDVKRNIIASFNVALGGLNLEANNIVSYKSDYGDSKGA